MVDELIDLLKGHRVFLQPHNFPDPDAIASCFGLQKFLEHFDIESKICYVGNIDRFNTKKMMETFGIEIYPYSEALNMQPLDYIVNVDCQKPNANTTDLPGDEVACVDHHPIFIKTDDYKYTDIRKTGACSSIVAGYFKDMKVPINEDVATALVYGIKMDTDDLIRGTTKFDVEMLDYLFDSLSHDKLNVMYNSNIEFDDLKAYGAAIENIDVYDNVGFTYIPFECSNSLVAIISDFILSLDVVEVAIVYSVNQDGIKFSVRSEISSIDAGKLVKEALKGIGSGGGHAVMAGGFIDTTKIENFNNDDYFGKIKELFMKALGEK